MIQTETLPMTQAETLPMTQAEILLKIQAEILPIIQTDKHTTYLLSSASVHKMMFCYKY